LVLTVVIIEVGTDFSLLPEASTGSTGSTAIQSASMEKGIEYLAASPKSIAVKNAGTTAIKGSELTITINGKILNMAINCNTLTKAAMPGEIISCEAGDLCKKGDTVVISSPDNSVNGTCA
jgi:hypothetical protein